MHNIIWLASYPKSGNTWMRLLLTNYRTNAAQPVHINHLNDLHSANRWAMDETLFVASSYFSLEEINRYRPHFYRQVAKKSTDRKQIVKVHDMWAKNADGMPIFPPDVTHQTIYLLRNPLDIAVSYAHHSAIDLDTMIKEMNNPKHYLVNPRWSGGRQVSQHLSSWHEHVLSWMVRSTLPVYLIRYEDMIQDTYGTFKTVLTTIGEEIDEARIERAIAHSSFEVLKTQESEGGFREKMAYSENFFRKGKVGSWREKLTDEQMQQIIDNHGETMYRFGYLTDDQKSIY